MQKTRATVRKSGWNPWLVPPSAILGASSGLFLYGYWLRDTLAVGDEQMLALTATIGIVAATGYFFLLSWALPNLAVMTAGARCALGLASIPIAAFVLFGGTSNWTSSNRYLAFLLPDHRLQLSALPADSAPGSSLVWFNTSLGDVSYGTIKSQGWKRVGDELLVQDPTSNSLIWTGDVGDKVQMVFSGASSKVRIVLTWDGQAETVALSKDKTAYSREFNVPFYASKTAIMLLGLLSFYALVLALCVLIWMNRSKLSEAAIRSMDRVPDAFSALDVWLMITAGLLAALLRVFNLGSVFPAVDEYYHLIAAKQIVQGAALSTVYPRGLWIVTIPAAAALKIFGNQLWAARLIGAIFNVLAVIPLYLLARKISRSVAVLACLLFATSPWIITFARVAREYAYYPFYFYWVILAMVLFVEGIPRGFIFLRDWKTLLRPKMLVLGVALLLPPVFALKIDWLSTFRTILIAYLALGLFILLRFDWHDRSNWPVLALMVAGVVVSGRSWYLEQSSKLLIVPQVNALPIEYFLPNPQQQWYLDRVVIIIALGILAALAVGFLVRRLNFVPLFVFTLFVGYLAVFALLSKTFFHTRHLLSTELWYVIVVAMGLYAVWGALTALIPIPGTLAQMLLAAAVGLSVMNAGQILMATVSTNPDMPISEDYMHDMSQVQAFMLAKVRPGDVLISTVYGQYAIWDGSPVFAAQEHITSHTPVQDILSLAAKYPSGWIVIDEIRFKLASMSIRDLAGHDQIEYLGQYGDERVWHWQRNSVQAGLVASIRGAR
jgi:hypothetical protein